VKRVALESFMEVLDYWERELVQLRTVADAAQALVDAWTEVPTQDFPIRDFPLGRLEAGLVAAVQALRIADKEERGSHDPAPGTV
jgi:response regulator of citrate/malate metabolism